MNNRPLLKGEEVYEKKCTSFLVQKSMKEKGGRRGQVTERTSNRECDKL